jgi:DNA-binding Lrp family transcriptional regulator
LPRGRVRQDPYEAKDESIRRILTALKQNPDGLRFKELKKITKLHQDTLSVRLAALVDDEIIKHPGKLYKIFSRGEDDLSRRDLINHIESSGFVVVGGPDDISPYTDEEIIMKSTVGYAFPAISPGVVGALRRVLHKYWMLHLVTSLAIDGKIDPRCLTGEKPLENMLDDLKSSMARAKLVLGFMIDQRELKERLNLDYVREIVRLAKIEDSNHLETKHPEYMKAFQRYAQARNTAG